MELLNAHWNDILTVTGLNEAIRDLLEDRFAFVRVRGEISDHHEPASGHVYFALIDGRSRLRCVIWKATRRRLSFQAAPGQKVVITGRIALYAPRGEYQLIVEAIQNDGQGDARARLLELHARLTAEGIFAPERKRPLPFFPTVIGIVTSATGAALQDVIRVLDDRGLGYHLIIAAARVQGTQAAGEIVTALNRLVHDGRAQVIICGRGGGSADDLAVFNDETVVRAVAASPIPVISAVGHEIDLTLTDLAADLRAPTPSAAAQMVLPERSHLEQRIRLTTQGLNQGFSTLIIRQNERLVRSSGRLQHPRRRIEHHRFQCDALEERLHHAVVSMIRKRHPIWTSLHDRLQRWPRNRGVLSYQQPMNLHGRRLRQEIRNILQQKSEALAALTARLNGVSPLAVLNRGYAILYNAQGTIQQKMGTLGPGDPVVIRLVDGHLDATVTHARKDP
ncbi:MAG: exodeoxyribonuclease VII large subunit [Magnetococcales bacterium]|nr:exodeoxyribonuclease VII large subunit [Magnetococcales bacterium]MBF0149648.1 exodeoxyribonuclease VII large subunit [Magnetococcales bacterium]MBF0631791.1 exodeoxyribonuclease VII large subunit [Magnetococcales bacterium]